MKAYQHYYFAYMVAIHSLPKDISNTKLCNDQQSFNIYEDNIV